MSNKNWQMSFPKSSAVERVPAWPEATKIKIVSVRLAHGLSNIHVHKPKILFYVAIPPCTCTFHESLNEVVRACEPDRCTLIKD